MHAFDAHNEGMRRMHYTIRGVPDRLDERARKIAREEGKSLNDTLLAALWRDLGVTRDQIRYSDLDDLPGTWVHDPEFDRAIEEMDRIDPELWK